MTRIKPCAAITSFTAPRFLGIWGRKRQLWIWGPILKPGWLMFWLSFLTCWMRTPRLIPREQEKYVLWWNMPLPYAPHSLLPLHFHLFFLWAFQKLQQSLSSVVEFQWISFKVKIDFCHHKVYYCCISECRLQQLTSDFEWTSLCQYQYWTLTCPVPSSPASSTLMHATHLGIPVLWFVNAGSSSGTLASFLKSASCWEGFFG